MCDVAPVQFVRLNINKAYTNVAWPALWAALDHIGLRGPLYRLLQDATMSSTLHLSTNTEDRCFSPNKGLKQGCPYSPRPSTWCYQGWRATYRRPARMCL